MRQSKLQMVELTLIKVNITPNPKFKKPSQGDGEEFSFALQSAKTAHKSPDYWDGDEAVDADVRNHTYTVNLGVRTPPSADTGYPYNFEIQFSAVIVNFDPTDGDPDKMAVKYGLALIYGAIRDQILSLTSKMKAGRLLVPTMSFEDENHQDIFAAHKKMIENKNKKISEQESPE